MVELFLLLLSKLKTFRQKQNHKRWEVCPHPYRMALCGSYSRLNKT